MHTCIASHAWTVLHLPKIFQSDDNVTVTQLNRNRKLNMRTHGWIKHTMARLENVNIENSMRRHQTRKRPNRNRRRKMLRLVQPKRK